MIFEYPETGSTQEELKKLYKNGDAVFFDAVSAIAQTEGKGRVGKTFFSPAGGLYLSMLLPYEEAETMTRAAGACAVRAIRRITGKALQIKPVNDLYLEGRKVCGILAEAVTDLEGKPKAVVLGIGINLVSPQEGFPEDIEKRAGALYKTPGEIGWIGEPDRIPANDTLSDFLLAGLRSRLMFALTEEFKKLSDPEQSEVLLKEYEGNLIEIM